MHRAAFVALALLGTATAWAEQPAPPDTVYISVGADALGTVAATASPIDILAADDQVAIMEVEHDDLEAIAHEMHERHGRCGGFMAHSSRADAEDAMRALRDRKKPERPTVDYTLDQPAMVMRGLAQLDKDKLLGTIRELSAMPSRFYKSETGAAASTWLADRWRSFSDRSDISIELVDHGWPQRSVVLTIPGAVHPAETVLIGGHLDSISFARGGRDAPGADDDASGIATMTETLRALLAADYRPARTLVFVAYAAEEVGLYGSQAIVKLFQQRGIRVVGALQLDMTNYQGSEKDIWLMKDFTSAEQNNFLIRLLDTYVGATWGLDACGYACSDHASWYRAGVPASMPFEARMRDRNKTIHSGKDTLETSGNNADHAIKFARLATAYAVELAKTAPVAAMEYRRSTATPFTESSSPSDCSRAWILGVLAALGAAGVYLSRRVTG